MLCLKLSFPQTLIRTTLNLRPTTMTHICVSLVTLSALIISSSSAGLVTESPSNGTCEILRGIENVQTNCTTGPIDADSECLLECAPQQETLRGTIGRIFYVRLWITQLLGTQKMTKELHCK